MSPKRRRKYYKYEKKTKPWTEESVQRAIEEVRSSKRSIRSVAKSFRMSFSTLQKALRRDSGADAPKKTAQGRHTILSASDEEAIVDILISCARANFGFSLSDIPRLIKDHILYIVKFMSLGFGPRRISFRR